MPAEREPIDVVTRSLVRACRALAEAGRPREAARLAADAWVALRHDHERQAEHLNGVMHHIARVEARMEAEGTLGPATQTSPAPAGGTTRGDDSAQ